MYLLVHRRSPELGALTWFFPWVWRTVLSENKHGWEAQTLGSRPTGHPREIPGRGWSLPHRGRPDIEELVLSVLDQGQRTLARPGLLAGCVAQGRPDQARRSAPGSACRSRYRSSETIGQRGRKSRSGRRRGVYVQGVRGKVHQGQ